MGLGGREFSLNIAGVNDFGRASDRTYIFGEGSNVAAAELNDPRTLIQLTTQDVDDYPIYLRKEDVGAGGNDDLVIIDAFQLTYTLAPTGTVFRTFRGLGTVGGTNITLAREAGLVFYLKP